MKPGAGTARFPFFAGAFPASRKDEPFPMKQALCALLVAAAVAFPCLALPAAASVESEPMSANIQDGGEDSEEEDPEDEDFEDKDGEDAEGTDAEDSSSEDENAASSPEQPGEQPPWWWDEEIDGVWYPGAENTPTASDSAPSESVLLQPVVIGDEDIAPNPVLARVTSILLEDTLADDLFPGRGELSVIFEAEVEVGNFKGTTVSAIQPLDEALSVHGRTATVGDSIYLTLYRDDIGTLRGEWSDFHRSPWILWSLTAAAVLLLLCTRRWGGFKLLFVLFAAALGALKGYQALIRAGMDAQGAAFLLSLLLVLIACPILYGIKFRTLAAAAGSLLSISTAGLLFYACAPALRLTGIANADLLRASFQQGIELHLPAALTAAAMLCATGAVVAVSNAAAAGAEPAGGEEISARQVYLRGYRSGSSALAPLSMALSLFSLGLLLPLVLPLLSAGFSAGRILSDERVTTEIVRLVTSLLGVMLSVPLTSALCALLLPLRRREEGGVREFHVWEALCARQQKLFGRAAAGIDSATLSIAGKTEEIDNPPQEKEETPEQ